jgi:hypothetical protein
MLIFGQFASNLNVFVLLFMTWPLGLSITGSCNQRCAAARSMSQGFDISFHAEAPRDRNASALALYGIAPTFSCPCFKEKG